MPSRYIRFGYLFSYQLGCYEYVITWVYVGDVIRFMRKYQKIFISIMVTPFCSYHSKGLFFTLIKFTICNIYDWSIRNGYRSAYSDIYLK